MADYKVQARHEIAIPTPAGGWTWGALPVSTGRTLKPEKENR